MIIIGEKLNSSIPKTFTALTNNDTDYLVGLIKAQAEAGAHYLDINTSICGKDELAKMLELISLVLEHSECGIMIDSASPDIIKSSIGAVGDRPTIINSVTLADRIDELLPVIKATGASVVALPIDAEGIPNTVDMRVANTELLINKITEYGISIDKIFIDVLAEALAVGNDNAMLTVRTISEIKKLFPSVKTTCGLSNISFGLPKRMNINSAFLSIAISHGLDSAIMDIISPTMQLSLATALALAGKDDYCMDYITAIRSME